MAEIFKDMGDWSMSKDYNGAERFNDGGRPLIAETELADIIISGCGFPPLFCFPTIFDADRNRGGTMMTGSVET